MVRGSVVPEREQTAEAIEAIGFRDQDRPVVRAGRGDHRIRRDVRDADFVRNFLDRVERRTDALQGVKLFRSRLAAIHRTAPPVAA